jgi:hypothetical protein
MSITKDERRALFPNAFSMLTDWKPHDDGIELYMSIPGEYEYGTSVGEGVPATVDHYFL